MTIFDKANGIPGELMPVSLGKYLKGKPYLCEGFCRPCAKIFQVPSYLQSIDSILKNEKVRLTAKSIAMSIDEPVFP